MNTAAAIGGGTVGIQLPLSDVQVLTMGFGGRRRPNVGAIGAIAMGKRAGHWLRGLLKNSNDIYK